jgi:alkylation response protein AidB-like acyl-CoA dehydrogenase
MDLLPSPDQAAVAAAVRELLAERAPIEVARVYDPRSGRPPGWDDLAAMGAFGLALSDEVGGVGLGLAEQALMFVELGRHLTTGPVLGTVLAAHVAAAAGSDLLGDFLSGTVSAGVATPRFGMAAVDGQTVTGDLQLVDTATAPFTVVVTPDAAAIVETKALKAQDVNCLDATVSRAVAAVSGATVVVSTSSSETWWRGALLVAAAQTGIAEAALHDAVEYAKVRQQFDRVIGGFQAVKHRCAEMATRAEVARFQVAYASLAGRLGNDASSLHVSSARVVAGGAARGNAADNILTHGAMGFSDESVAHLFARRAEVLDGSIGSTRWHVEALALRPPLDPGSH